jgi:hypothetical protein
MQEQSTLDANKALVRRRFEEVWNKGRAEAVDEMFAADGIAHGLSDDAGNPLKGQTLFVNLQVPGMTFAIWGPWERIDRAR